MTIAAAHVARSGTAQAAPREPRELVALGRAAEAGVAGSSETPVSNIEARGVEAPADWSALRSPENYVGYERTQNSSRLFGPRAIGPQSMGAGRRVDDRPSGHRS
ncbi:MAG: hypothetical protein DMF84_30170 [Acidobacteria bacterium]|nr:MAG: hypothetical protein DMF84_30170 [Acidobacteriota bacterium]